MTKMILNGSVNIPITGYNRYTNISGGHITSNANITLVSAEAYNALVALVDEDVESIEIQVDDEKIYEITNQNGRITGINEYLNGNTVALNMSISFGEDAEGEEVV